MAVQASRELQDALKYLKLQLFLSTTLHRPRQPKTTIHVTKVYSHFPP